MVAAGYAAISQSTGFEHRSMHDAPSQTAAIAATRIGRLILLLGLACGVVACCKRHAAAQAPGAATLRVWAHAGQAGERNILRAQVEQFNARNPDLHVYLEFLPERNYNAQVQAAGVAGDLPDVLELDGPYLYNYVWEERLQPLQGWIPSALRADLLPSIVAQGTYRGHLYGVGSFDSGLGLYARRSALAQAGARIPAHPREAWSLEEFETLLERLAKIDDDGAVLDLKLNYPDEWFIYAFAPLI